MTSGQADAREAPNNPAPPRIHQIEARPLLSRPLTASHVATVLVPGEQPRLVRYAAAIAATVVALAITFPLASMLRREIFVLFWPAVIGSAWFGGVGPAILSSTLSVLLADYFLIGPPGELALSSPDDLVPLAVFLLVSTAVAFLTSAARSAQRASAKAAANNAELAVALDRQALELEQQLEESQALSEELQQSTEELADRTAAAEAAELIADRLYSLTAQLAEANSDDDVARIVIANLQEGASPKRVAIYRVENGDNGRSDLVMMAEGGVEPSRRARFGRLPIDGNFPLSELLRKREAAFVDDAAAFQERFPWWPADGGAVDQQAWAAVPLIASTGQALGALALGFDHARTFDPSARRYITSIGDQATQAFERVRLLQAEHAARQAAEDANRAKTQFLATMSHELRTPLNAISGYAELLSLGLRGPTTPEQQEDLGRIMRSQRHLLSIINDILNFARLETGHIEYRVVAVRVTELLMDLESLIRPQLVAKQLQFSCDEVNRDVAARADIEKVQQVLLNLLANAVKFTAPGGHVRVRSDHDERHVYIRVIDTGIGIPLDRRAAIFEPFVQLHRTLAQPAEGTGLGLAISRDLARGMGGELSVESEPGHGSTFTLVLDREKLITDDR